MRKALLLAVALSVIGSAALADDLNPPPWDRQDPAATFQHWTFDTQPVDMAAIPPDIDENQFGDPLIIDSYSTSSEWLESYQGRQGVWHAYWDFWIDLPNDPEPRPLKDIYVQFTYFYNDPTGWDNGRPIIDDVFIPEGVFNIGLVDEFQLEGDWWYSRWHIEIEPNVDFESLHVIADDGYSELIFDQIVVDTICIPEPAGMLLLGFAGLFIRRR